MMKNLSRHIQNQSSYFHKELENVQSNENNIKIITIKSSIYDRIFGVILKENFNDLLNFCDDIIANYSSLTFESSKSNFLPEFTSVKWEIAQNPTLPTNLGE
ncbi:hypothetical protein Glove_117g96 [Diversispora epigaea]|uniref:Uncharacterized protein n=1 Tax=Diversispora epigaea TaxID=1348612 RepID=A0A397J310_9GLOM|nr:hypothetical protein Glove_117g96 [Diversispora epigaea]